MGPEKAAVVRSRGVAAKQGFLMYYTKGVAIGNEVSVSYKESGRFSGVVVKRGSTVWKILQKNKLMIYGFHCRHHTCMISYKCHNTNTYYPYLHAHIRPCPEIGSLFDI